MMMSKTVARHAMVFGASGLIGRYLVLTLANAGAMVTAAVRTAESGARVRQWAKAHGVTREIRTVIVDFDASEIVDGSLAAYETVTEIHNCAGSYRFGMTAQEARQANVGIVEKLIAFAARLPNLQRLVHISGYRVGGQDPAEVPWSHEHRAAEYRRLGAYEASKVESDAVFQRQAQDAEIAWTIVNPSSVIGDSISGESDQLIGLATTIEQLYHGQTVALPGGDDIFLPVVTVDYLAKFMVAAAVDPAAAGQAYWVLDDETPPLARLLEHVGLHLGVRVPRLRVPVSVIKRLPQQITKVDPETLTFMSTERYPTASAKKFAAKHAIAMPNVGLSLERWADYLVAHRFGAAKVDERRLRMRGGLRTFELGAVGSNRLILPGLPVNADTWSGVASRVPARVVDLPGLGLSGGSGVEDWAQWLPGILDGEPVHLVGHSIGAAAAVLAAETLPTQILSLTLVSPFFLQPPARAVTRLQPAVRAYLRCANSARLSRFLTGTGLNSGVLESSASDLKRGGAKQAAEQISLAGSARWRAELRAAMDRFNGPIRIVTGGDDPLSGDAIEQLRAHPNVELATIPGAGHHPQLTHSDALADLLQHEYPGARCADLNASHCTERLS